MFKIKNVKSWFMSLLMGDINFNFELLLETDTVVFASEMNIHDFILFFFFTFCVASNRNAPVVFLIKKRIVKNPVICRF